MLDQRRDHEDRVRAIVETVLDGIITIDANGTIETFNPAAEKIFGYSESELRGCNISCLMPEPYRSAHDSYLHQFFNTGKARIIGIGREVAGLRQDGSEFHMELAVSEMTVAGQRMFTGVVRDITERKKMEMYLVQTSKLASLGEMATGIAHELNQPLNVIRMIAESMEEIIEEKELPPDMIRLRLKRISEQVERASSIVNQIRAFGPDASDDFGPISVSDAAATVVQFVQESFRGHGVEIHSNISVINDTVVGNTFQLEQVILNLLINARDSIEDKFNYDANGMCGHISVCVRSDPDAAHVRIDIDDNGTGFKTDIKQHLFDPFFSSKHVGTGMGMGLSVAYGIISAMGGSITAENLDHGARFSVALPNVSSWPRVG